LEEKLKKTRLPSTKTLHLLKEEIVKEIDGEGKVG
jgi:hypothetical protein